MWPRNGKRMIVKIAGLLMLAVVALTGCVRVEVVDTAPSASTAEPFASPSLVESGGCNLAILAVDFDPPLDYQHLIIERQSVALLVAIENTGNSSNHNVAVRAELSTAEDASFFLTQGASIASIAPGEVQVVRFSRLGDIPYYQTYHLEVMVDPVLGESDLGDNRKAFEIQILQESSDP